jgi:hypothetical protein
MGIDTQRLKIRPSPKAKFHKVSVERGQAWSILACTPEDAACEAARIDPEANTHFEREDDGPLYVLVDDGTRLWVWTKEEPVPVEHVKAGALRRRGFDPSTVTAVTYYAVPPRDDYADPERWGFERDAR